MDKNADPTISNDPMEFAKALFGGFGAPLPGLAMPTLDINELDKQINDMKAVENWMKMNLSMLQTSIQALEMQKSTVEALCAMNQGLGGSNAAQNAEPQQEKEPAEQKSRAKKSAAPKAKNQK